jgi:hypothetical protein
MVRGATGGAAGVGGFTGGAAGVGGLTGGATASVGGLAVTSAPGDRLGVDGEFIL